MSYYFSQTVAIDPIASMQAVGNPELGEIAAEIQAELKRVVDNV